MRTQMLLCVATAGCAMHARAFVGVVHDSDTPVIHAGIVGGLGMAGVSRDGHLGLLATAGVQGGTNGMSAAFGGDILFGPERQRLNWRVGGLGSAGTGAPFQRVHAAALFPWSDRLTADEYSRERRRIVWVVGVETQYGWLARDDPEVTAGIALTVERWSGELLSIPGTE